jgi:methylated-DNA-[protein]-cysteine S-methyltransferase
MAGRVRLAGFGHPAARRMLLSDFRRRIVRGDGRIQQVKPSLRSSRSPPMSHDSRSPRSFTTLESPVGTLRLTATADGLIDGLSMAGQRHAPPAEEGMVRDEGPFAELAGQLGEYFAGAAVEFDVPLSLRGTPFQQRVWAALREIPYGETISYGELARRLGTPGASRAVGLANGRNPVAIVIPCHRVIGADGRLTGYGGGLERKSWLLRHEAGALELPERVPRAAA